MRENETTIVPDYVSRDIIQKNEHILFRKVYMKYLILKVRAKISYMAFVKKMTIAELFATTILRCHETLVNEGLIKSEFPEQEEE